MIKLKKSAISQIVSIFILVLVISILSGISFILVSTWKAQAYDTNIVTESGTTVVNQSGWLNSSGFPLTNGTVRGYSPTINVVLNATDNVSIDSGNYTVISGYIYNASSTVWSTVKISYDYTYSTEGNAYKAINTTENAGYNTTTYLGLIFLALIFGAVLTIVLKIILPYINLGRNMDSF